MSHSSDFGRIPWVFVSGKIVKWDTDASFQKGTYSTSEIAVTSNTITLVDGADNSDDIPYTDSSNYTYSTTNIEFSGSAVRLKAISGNSTDYPFTTTSNYTYDSSNATFSSGVVKLKEVSAYPYAWWHLNESNGTSANDASGHGRHGTLQNMEDADWQAGKLNNCLVFDGVNEYVDCGNIANFGKSDPFSFECWVNTTATSKDILTRYSGNGYLVFLNSSGKLYVTLRKTSATDECSKYSNGVINTGTWTHIVVTYDGSASTSGLNIYINGSLDNGTGGKDTLTSDFAVVANFLIGKRTGGTSYYTGKIDEVIIYDYELTTAQIAARYNSGSGTENIYAFSTANPTVVNNTAFAFVSQLETFIETATAPTGTAIKYNLSDDNGATWYVWNGAAWATSSGTYASANSASTCNTNISSFFSSGSFKFKAFLHSTAGNATPELDNIHVAELLTYGTGNYEVEYNTDIQPTYNYGWMTFTETSTAPTGTTILHQYSEDSGVSYNGTWLTAASAQNTIQAIGSPTKLRIKSQLHSTSNTSRPELDNINITSDRGYATSGTYYSNQYSSGRLDQDWEEIDFDISTSSATNIVISAKAANTTAALGSASYSVMTDESNPDLIGKYVQWKAVLTGSPIDRPTLNSLKLKFTLAAFIPEDA